MTGEISRVWTIGVMVVAIVYTSVAPIVVAAHSEQAVVHMFSQTMPSVVGIASELPEVPWQPPKLDGTGFIWDNNGHVVTNHHVIEGKTSLHVVMYDDTAYHAELVGSAPEHDLAVLKIVAPETVELCLCPITLGNSRQLRVGEDVYAIGNPLGSYQMTLTAGTVSGIDRTLDGEDVDLHGIIQTDAALNPGQLRRTAAQQQR